MWKRQRVQHQQTAAVGTSGVPVELDAELDARFRETAASWATWCERDTTLTAAEVDHERGSIRLTFNRDQTLTLAVDDLYSAEQVEAMTGFGPCHIRITASGPRVVVEAQREQWTYQLSGLPALA